MVRLYHTSYLGNNNMETNYQFLSQLPQLSRLGRTRMVLWLHVAIVTTLYIGGGLMYSKWLFQECKSRAMTSEV